MRLWPGKEIHIPVNAGEPVEILILGPAAACPLEDLRGQLVFAVPDIGGQVKFRRGEAVLAVSHILSVQPERHAALHTLEGNVYGHALHGFRKGKILYIACRRVEPGGNLPGQDLLPAVPWILHVQISGDIVALHLDMGRHPDLSPVSAVIVIRLKALDRVVQISSIRKLPDAVQGKAERILTPVQVVPVRIADMVRMSGDHVFLKKFGIFDFAVVKHDVYLLITFFARCGVPSFCRPAAALPMIVTRYVLHYAGK